MTENSPQNLAIVLVSLVQTIWRLVGEGIEKPHADVGYKEEHEQFSTRLVAPELLAVATATEAVHDQWGLDDYLDDLLGDIRLRLVYIGNVSENRYVFRKYS